MEQELELASSKKDEVAIHAMKAYRRNGGVPTHFRNLGSRRR